MSDYNITEFKNETYLDFSDPTHSTAQKKALEEVRNQFGKTYDLYINGEHLKGDEGTMESRNPSNTDEVIGTVQKASSTQADAAMDAAWDAFESWQYVPAGERAEYLLKAADVVRRRRLEINAWMISEAGKNYLEADADTCEAIDFLVYYAHEAMRLDKGMPVIDSWGDENRTIYMPMGAGVSISPWNFPFAIFVGMAAAPIAAGNTVVAKPAPDTPVVAHILVQIFEEVGLPKGVFNYITGGDIEVGERLARNPKTRFITFTGSMPVGLHLTEIAAERGGDDQLFIKRVVTELGGKNAVVVDEDADIDLAAGEIVKAAFGFQGQKCSAGSRVVAHEKIYDELLEKVVEHTNKLEVGDAKDDCIAGPVINQKAVDKIMGYIEIGKKEGRLMAGGERAETGKPGYYIQPTVFADVDPDARIAQEEIFGPVTAFIKAKDTDDAIRIANSTRFGLTGGYFSRDPKKIEKALREFKVGNLYINRKNTGALVGAQPFGGFNMSGTDSKAGGRDYLLYFMQPKSMTVRPHKDVDFSVHDFKYGIEK